MTTRPAVGLPRALLHYEYGQVWQRLVEGLGAEPVVSPPTDRALLNRGVMAVIDEACLPVKAAIGHCLALAGNVDVLMVPRVVSVEPRAYSCPKLLGLPDMVRLVLPPSTRVLAPVIDLSGGGRPRLRPVAAEAGALLGASPGLVARAARELETGLRRAVQGTGGQGRPAAPAASPGGPLVIGLVGHSYNLHDPGLNLGLADKLRRLGVGLLTPEDFPPAALLEAARTGLRKPLFWTLGRRLVGAALLMAARPEVAGIIAVVSFGCGPDSMVVDLSMRLAGRRRPGLPFMELTLDEHTGEAGLATRLEAFVDLAWRRQRAGQGGVPCRT